MCNASKLQTIRSKRFTTLMSLKRLHFDVTVLLCRRHAASCGVKRHTAGIPPVSVPVRFLLFSHGTVAGKTQGEQVAM